MKHLFLFSIFVILALAIQHAKAADDNSVGATTITCSTSVINSVYIPKLREVADWSDDELRPYAVQLCKLEKQREALQKSIKARADELRTTNWRICKEVIPGNPNPTPDECRIAYAQTINSLIDHCIAVVNMGHNPHNVQLFINPVKVEVACLKGVNTALQ
ncbi:hypothetical protein [Bdellovibrio svalbardensis]|uniref:DUF1311 domain-containing protein n=1 Tax=Bdellovibrio svalbardensis TaxID=2972972 RepID=A0ABT6DN47_9BACT|nr:hypothetical protein [Bdellovibrio svalbardensis]MDG0817246.1 hypothetical protein [Bdellovibrio svalbardensis]